MGQGQIGVDTPRLQPVTEHREPPVGSEDMKSGHAIAFMTPKKVPCAMALNPLGRSHPSAPTGKKVLDLPHQGGLPSDLGTIKRPLATPACDRLKRAAKGHESKIGAVTIGQDPPKPGGSAPGPREGGTPKCVTVTSNKPASVLGIGPTSTQS